MSSTKRISISVQPLNYADIPSCAHITASAFSKDPHTIVKQLGGSPFDMYYISRSGFLATLHRKTYIYVKAVDEETGEIVGHAGWGFRGVEEELIPWKGPEDEKPVEEEQVESQSSVDEQQRSYSETRKEDQIERLHALEDADMQDWMSVLMPPGTSCMYILGLIISPAHQSRGVGSALIQYGNAIADQLGLFTWVHSSDQAWKAYRKFGFEVVGDLDVDLDEYAPRGPRDGEEVMGEKGMGKWGRYVIRYMKRLPGAGAR